MPGRAPRAWAAVAATTVAVAAGCPCCPTCNVCPCGGTVAPSLTPTPPAALRCNLNCYGEAAVPVPLPGGNGNGVPAESLEICRDFCTSTQGCEAVVFGGGKCWGKKDVRTSKCQPGGEYVMEMVDETPFGTCSLLGDPHVLTFDDPNGLSGMPGLSQLAAGDFNLVKADNLVIQGRFGYSERFPTAASLTGLAVGGELISKHRLTVEYIGPKTGREGFKVWWDGTEILNGAYPATFKSKDRLFEARAEDMDPDDFGRQARHTIGGTAGKLPSFVFQLAPDIQIYLLLGQETMNAVISMRRMRHPMDGYCGNFNCRAEDDVLKALEARGVAKAFPRNESLFQTEGPKSEAQKHQENRIAVDGAVVSMLSTNRGVRGDDGAEGGAPMIQECDKDKLDRADRLCQHLQGGFKSACIFDYCASGSERMGREDVAAAAVAVDLQHTTKMFGWLGAWLPPALGGAEAPPALQAAAALLLAGLFLGGLAAGSQRRGLRVAVSDVRFGDALEDGQWQASDRAERAAAEVDPLLGRP